MVHSNYIRLTRWAAQHGMHRMTAWRHYIAGTLPPELQAKKIGNIIYVLAACPRIRFWRRKAPLSNRIGD